MLDAIDNRLGDQSNVIVATAQLKAGIMALLTSPDFLSIIEHGTSADSGRLTLSQHEIATRLALLVSSQLPDAQLLQATADASLTDPAERGRQLDRLLAGAAHLRSLL